MGERFERISIDIIGPHPKSSKWNRFILSVVDHFTKYAEGFPIANHEAVTVARHLVRGWLLRFGSPMQISSDRGAEFEGHLFAELRRLLEIDKLRTTAYKPSTNGVVEKFHRTLNMMLGKVVSLNQRNRDEHLLFVLAAYRASVHESTGFTPNFLVFGAELRAPIDLVLGVPGQETNESYNEFLQQHAEMSKEAYTLVWDQLKRSAERRKKDYDLRVNKRSFDVGNWVWYYCPKRVTGRSPKWQRYFSGPYLVVRVIDPVNLVLQRSSKAKTFVVHNDKVKRFQGEPPRSCLDQERGPSAGTSTQQTKRQGGGDASKSDDGMVESETDPHPSQPRRSPCAERTKRKIIKPARFRLTRCYTE